jgi:hypothetical protein
VDLGTPPFATSPVASADNEGAKGAKETKDTEDAKETKDTEETKDSKDAKEPKDSEGAEEAVSLPAISFRSSFFVRGPQPTSPPAVIPSSHLPLSH